MPELLNTWKIAATKEVALPASWRACSPFAGLTSSVDFYRKQLARQRDLGSHPWRYLSLFVPGVGLSLFGRALDRSAAQNAAIAAFGVALFLAVAWLNRRSVRGLQREIDELG